MSENDTPEPPSAPDTPAASEHDELRPALLDAAQKSMSENDALFRKLAQIEEAERNSGQSL